MHQWQTWMIGWALFSSVAACGREARLGNRGVTLVAKNPATLNNEAELRVPLQIVRVGSAAFSRAQIDAMLSRTNRKLAPAGIAVFEYSYDELGPETLSDVTAENIETILQHRAESGLLRLFLIREDRYYGLQSWTYDPYDLATYPPFYRGAIFITQAFNENSDEHYVQMGYQPTNDTLLHELGHVLMQSGDHYREQVDNFFHESGDRTNDAMTDEQIARLRAGPYILR